VLASVFQKFDLFLADPSYTLQIKQALTIKPKGLMVRAVPRRKIAPSPSIISRPLGGDGVSSSKEATERGTTVSGMKPAKTVHVFYGSNTGTCEGLAQRVVSDAGAKGKCES
jgi:cytochrome P450/NADPH-cytochrome P450 reductase